VSLPFEAVVTDRNMVTGPAWTAHVLWIEQFFAVPGMKISQHKVG